MVLHLKINSKSKECQNQNTYNRVQLHGESYRKCIIVPYGFVQ